MKIASPRSTLPAAVVAAVLATLVASPALAQTVTVTLDGNPMGLNPAPITRDGRIFVPLRGVFEQLGASVVYANGTINAQGHNRSISLSIGSTQVTVDGRSQTIDVAPFIIGASTYVPLRFVSQALGDVVNYDGSQNLVAITSGARDNRDNRDHASQQNTMPAPAPEQSALRLRDVSPGRDATVSAMRPSIEAQFANVDADPNSLRITLDGTDVTSSTMRSSSGFVFSPPSDLQAMQHTLRITGRDTSGADFDQTWNFSSGRATIENRISNVLPDEGSTVGAQFTVRGRTMPGARVVILVGANGDRDRMSGQLGAIFGMNVRNETTADADGYFTSVVNINAASGASLRMTVNSTDVRSNSAAPPVTRFLAMR